MLNYLIPIIAGCVVLLLFMLVFIRKDGQGKRGGRLAGCAHHDADKGCDRCRDRPPATILTNLPDWREDPTDNNRPGIENPHGHP
jgi:hypothetical protein